MVTRRKTPPGLGPAGARLWRKIAGDGTFELRPDELRILEDACREADLIDGLAEAQRGAPLTVAGSQGQLVIHPLISELRQHRSTLAGLLKQLALPDAESEQDSQRPRSTQARAAANSRWHSGPSGISGRHR